MLVLAIHFWWASFGLARRENWDFTAFAAVLAQCVMLFMAAALLLPNPKRDQPIDLRAHYYSEAGPFFCFGLLFILFGFLKDWLLDRHILGGGMPLAFFLFFLATAVVALFVRKPRVHEILAPVVAVAVAIFIAMMFAKLGKFQ
jgi:hypothetical protein